MLTPELDVISVEEETELLNIDTYELLQSMKNSDM
jgi:hypothetical protein